MSADNIQGLDTLEAWKRSKDFALRVYKDILPLLPSEEKWSLNQQIRRSAQSVPANIAEGHGRFYYQENVRFCYIARGLLTEVYSHITLAHELGFIPSVLYKEIKKTDRGAHPHHQRLYRLSQTFQSRSKRTRREPPHPGRPRSLLYR